MINTDVYTTLYLCITNKCNLNCKYCYIHDKDIKKDDVASLGDLIVAMDKVQPQSVIITGGEPLLYPQTIIDYCRFYEANLRKHWLVTLCTNLYYKELSEKQLEAISHVDSIQTSYSIDRVLLDNNFIDILKHNIETIRTKCKNIHSIDVLWTITKDQLNQDPKEECEKILSLDIDTVGLESVSYSSKIKNFNWQDYYIKTDNYINQCFDYIPDCRNMTISMWNNCLDGGLYPMHCNICTLGCAKTFDNGKIEDRCNCLLEFNENRSEKFKKYCISCDLYKYCEMDCERFGNYCAFPKKAFRKYLEKRNK